MKDRGEVLLFLATAILLIGFSHCSYNVILTDNGPAVSGANITITAKVYARDDELARGNFEYQWSDNANPAHTDVQYSANPISQWNVSYPVPLFKPKTYQVEVYVEEKGHYFFFNSHSVLVKRDIQITNLLNGEIHLWQNLTGEVTNGLVASNVPVVHKVILKQADLNFLSSATDVSTYWFIDCVYYGQSRDFEFNYTFKDVGMEHSIEALVIASFDKPTPINHTTPIAATTMAPATTQAITTSSSSNSLAPKPTASSQNQTTNATTVVINATTPPAAANASIGSITAVPAGNISVLEPPPFNTSEFICLNTSVIPKDVHKTYGHFSKKLGVRAPVGNLTYTGTNWLQPGDILNLQVYCNGSGTFEWCTYEETQDYNVTGNESCLLRTQAENCSFPVMRLPSTNITMIIIVTNDVSKGVLGAKINLYSVQKRAQLSVIIVPITCSMIAVVLIVFGIAYYVQSRARFTVEIADFDFGQSDDLEYKTFRERLFDAVNNAVNRVEVLDEENTTTGTGNKYLSLP